ncbi:Glycosyl transferases group 1 [compost metagenome]
MIFSALKGLRNCVLTLCVREREWDSNYYNVPDNVRVVHLFGEEMLNEMLSSDVLIMVYPPVEYRDFAVPVKLYEAMGCGLPVIVSSHGEAAEIVRKEGVGWVVDDLVQLKNLLLQLSGDIAFRDDMRDAVGRAAQKNRWSDRASFVCEVLMTIKGKGG